MSGLVRLDDVANIEATQRSAVSSARVLACNCSVPLCRSRERTRARHARSTRLSNAETVSQSRLFTMQASNSPSRSFARAWTRRTRDDTTRRRVERRSKSSSERRGRRKVSGGICSSFFSLARVCFSRTRACLCGCVFIP